MCCEVLGYQEEADKYYCLAGKFCNLANNMRTGGAWRRMREQIENAEESLSRGRANSSLAEPLVSREHQP